MHKMQPIVTDDRRCLFVSLSVILSLCLLCRVIRCSIVVWGRTFFVSEVLELAYLPMQDGVGDTSDSYAYDGSRVCKWNDKMHRKYGEVCVIFVELSS